MCWIIAVEVEGVGGTEGEADLAGLVETNQEELMIMGCEGSSDYIDFSECDGTGEEEVAAEEDDEIGGMDVASPEEIDLLETKMIMIV